jgi:hypothetical protein
LKIAFAQENVNTEKSIGYLEKLMHGISGAGPPSWGMGYAGTRRLISGIDQARRFPPEFVDLLSDRPAGATGHRSHGCCQGTRQCLIQVAPAVPVYEPTS